MASNSMSTMTYDQLFETALGLSVAGIVIASLWIVAILISIEANNSAFYTVNVDVDGDGGGGHSLQMHEEMTNGGRLEVEPSTMKAGPRSPSSSSNKQRPRRVRASFKLMQLGSVAVMVLLTYLLLVVTEAPKWASALGSLCVFGFFLRFQIGDELRRQRLDRIAMMLSMFLIIASLMSVCTYASKSLANGEIYQGPARIVGYDFSAYNNSAHDPSTRTDLQVQWGKGWGCPLSGGKVCQAPVEGAMCTANVENGDRRRRRRQQKQRIHQRVLADTIEEETVTTTKQETTQEDTEQESETASGQDAEVADETQENEDLATENQELEEQNAELEKEVEELELENEEEKEVAAEEVEEVEAEEDEDAMIYDEDIETVEEEEVEIEKEYTDAYVAVEEEEIEIEEKYETDPNAVEQDEANIEGLDEEIEELDEVYDEEKGDYAENAEEFGEAAEVYEDEANEIQDEEEETKAEYDAEIEALEESSGNGEGAESEEGDDWYWEDITYEYDDDMYDTEYWDYQWDSVWGEYACEDLFDEDTYGMTYDTSVPAGTDDYPFINIYGSCKTCEAYILDYFAEEAFESVDEHRRMAIAYMTFAIGGLAFSFLAYIKFKAYPSAENEIELLGGDSGVMA